jgi:hypothetical protein
MSRLFVMLLIVGSIAMPLSAQSITVRLLDGKTGKPIADKNITVRWDSDRTIGGTVVRIGKDGTGHVDVPRNATGFLLMEGPKGGSESNRLAYSDCNVRVGPYNSVSDVLSHGVVPGNTCSKKAVISEPGVIVFWGLTRRWYELDMQ